MQPCNFIVYSPIKRFELGKILTPTLPPDIHATFPEAAQTAHMVSVRACVRRKASPSPRHCPTQSSSFHRAWIYLERLCWSYKWVIMMQHSVSGCHLVSALWKSTPHDSRFNANTNLCGKTMQNMAKNEFEREMGHMLYTRTQAQRNNYNATLS